MIDLRGKGGRLRTVEVPIWAKQGIDAWMTAARVDKGHLLRPISKSGKILGDWVIWSVVEQSGEQIGIEHFGAHDLRRTCAELCRKNGGDLEQIKFLLGHSSLQTTSTRTPHKNDLFYPARRGNSFVDVDPANEAAFCADMARLAYCRKEPSFAFDRESIASVQRSKI